MSCDAITGQLLKTFAASKNAIKILELGTGCGVSTSWLLEGMNEQSSLLSVEHDPITLSIARRMLSNNPTLMFVEADVEEVLESQPSSMFDLIFADAWVGKFHRLDDTLNLLRPNGLYFVDDLLPQETWPKDHAPNVASLIEDLRSRGDLIVSNLNVGTGLAMCVKI